MTKTDQDIINEFDLDPNTLSPAAMDGNILFRERLDEVYEEISLCRGISHIGTICDDEEIENSFLD